MYYYINNFLIFSLLGYIYETILTLIKSLKMPDNPFIGPWMPVYGFGIVIIIFITRFIFNKFKIPKYAKIIMIFLMVIIILTPLELLGGIITEKIFNKSFWDYSDMKYNYGKYICLEVSILWGIGCIIFLYFIKPITDKIIKKIPKVISIIITILIFVDFIYSFFIK